MKWDIKILIKIDGSNGCIKRSVIHDQPNKEIVIKELIATVAHLQENIPDRSLDITVGDFIDYCNSYGVDIPSRIIMAAESNEGFRNTLLNDLNQRGVYNLRYCHFKTSVTFFKQIMNYRKNKI